MINKAILVGYLGSDPEQAMSTHPVTFSLATSDSYRDKTTGEKRQSTSWHNVVIWAEGLQKVALEYLKKGHKVYLEGQIITRSYESNGVKRWTTEIVLSPFKSTLVLLQSQGGGRAPAPTREDHGVRDYQRPLDEETHAGAAYGDSSRSRSGPGDYYRGDPNAKPRTTMDTLDDEIPF